MIGIVNKFLLAGNKFIPEMQQPGFTYSACGPFTKKKKNTKKYKIFKKQEIHNIFIKTNQMKLVFNLTWLMEILKI